MTASIPIRVRLAAAFAVALLVVLALAGTFVYTRVSKSLDESLEESLSSRVDDLSALVAASGSTEPTLDGTRLRDSEDSFSQIVTPSGELVASNLGSEPAITPAEARAATADPILIDEREVPGVDGAARVLAAPASSAAGGLVVVAGESTEDANEVLDGIVAAFAIGAPLAVLLASGIGYLLARRSLAPVEAMTTRASEIGGERTGERLPLPPADDEIRRLGVTLNEMLERLDEAIARQRELVADAGHELRTPLASLRAELELASEGGRGADELRAAIAAGIQDVDRLARLADDLLLVARAEGGALPIHREPVRVHETLGRVVSRIAPLAGEAGRRIVANAPPALIAQVDPMRLEQAVGNLIDNAIRHGSGTVRVGARSSGDALVVEVADEGPGFPPGFEEVAFDRFSRPDEGRTGPGAGLGLAIVRAIAEAHGGEASIAGGATVRVSFGAAVR